MVRMAFALRDLDVESIPVNFLNPIDGTPLAGRSDLNPRYCLKVLAMFRFANPSSELRIAGGRELHLGSLQAAGPVPGQLDLRRRLSDHQGQAPSRLPDDRRTGLRRHEVTGRLGYRLEANGTSSRGARRRPLPSKRLMQRKSFHPRKREK